MQKHTNVHTRDGNPGIPVFLSPEKPGVVVVISYYAYEIQTEKSATKYVCTPRFT